jgi:hypothetical protein
VIHSSTKFPSAGQARRLCDPFRSEFRRLSYCRMCMRTQTAMHACGRGLPAITCTDADATVCACHPPITTVRQLPVPATRATT